MFVTRPVQINTGTRPLMPPPALVMKMAAALPKNNTAANVIRDKKTGGNYSAAGDDDINDVAAMGGVNLAEEANVSLNSSNHPKVRPDTYLFTSEYSRCYGQCGLSDQILQR